MACGVFQQIKSIHHSSFLYENSDFPTFFPATFSSRVCHQGAYRFGSPVYLYISSLYIFYDLYKYKISTKPIHYKTKCAHMTSVVCGSSTHTPIYDIKAMMIEDGDITCTLVSTVKYSYQLKAGGC